MVPSGCRGGKRGRGFRPGRWDQSRRHSSSHERPAPWPYSHPPRTVCYRSPSATLVLLQITCS